MNCFICERIQNILDNKNPHFVHEMETGFVVLGDYQFFRGYTLFLCKDHVTELHDLPLSKRAKFLIEMSQVAQAVFRAFQPKKLNYELLGNGEPHLHWHIFPRHGNDPNPTSPIWVIDKSIREAENTNLPASERDEMKNLLKNEIIRLSEKK